jgi:hypothetical protein
LLRKNSDRNGADGEGTKVLLEAAGGLELLFLEGVEFALVGIDVTPGSLPSLYCCTDSWIRDRTAR